MTESALKVDSDSGFIYFLFLFFFLPCWEQRDSLSGGGRPFSVAALIWSDICDGGETHLGECLAPQVSFDKRGIASQGTLSFFSFFIFVIQTNKQSVTHALPA